MNVPELAGALGHWLGNANLRAAAAERAKRFVAEQYDARAIAQQWVAFYASLTGSG